MNTPNRQTISVLFVAFALALAIGPALAVAGGSGASVQAGGDDPGDEVTNETADVQTTTETSNETGNQTLQTHVTIDQITVDRISIDNITIEGLTIEGLEMTVSGAHSMLGQMPAEMDGVYAENETVDDAATDEETDEEAATDGDAAADDEAAADDCETAHDDEDQDAAADETDEEMAAADETDEETAADDEEDEEMAADDETDEETAADDETDEETAADDEEDEETATDDETRMQQTDALAPGVESYNVSELDAPENATVGEQLTVTAEISNPNDVESNQSVEFRIDGDVIERQYVELDGEESETVTFEIDTEGLEAGDYNHGVLTFDNGEVADISLEAEDDEEEAPVDDEEEAPVDDEEDAEPNASVTFEDQETNGSTVTVQNVNVSEGGFVTIHDSSLLEGETIDSVIGTSEYLEPGEHEDVEVQLYDNETVPGAEFDQDALEENQTLIAMPHLDTNDNETYDFIETEGEVDGPYTENGEAVVDDADITVVDEEQAPTEDGEEDGAPNVTLDVADQSGNGEMLTVQEASASVDFYVVARYDGETSESQTFNAVEERLDYSLTLDPAIENDTTVEVAILSAEDDQELTAQQIQYDVQDGAAGTDGNVTDGNVTDGNVTDGNATGVTGNETAGLLA